ncbi:MAG: type II toxin-antitoxin system VapC family toxin [Burkholderiales bacterium]
MYLIDTDVISEIRKRERADPGVAVFFRQAVADDTALYLSAITVGELRRGVEIIRQRGDADQAGKLEQWLTLILNEYSDNVLPIDGEIAQIWARLRVPHPENPLDKLIAATALIHDLTLVTRNVRHFAKFGVRLVDPFGRS